MKPYMLGVAIGVAIGLMALCVVGAWYLGPGAG